MAKRATVDLPQDIGQTREVRTAPPLPASAIVELPLGDAGDGYASRHVEARLDERQRKNLRRLLVGLTASEERLADGQPVKSNADAVRWVLEQLG